MHLTHIWPVPQNFMSKITCLFIVAGIAFYICQKKKILPCVWVINLCSPSGHSLKPADKGRAGTPRAGPKYNRSSPSLPDASADTHLTSSEHLCDAQAHLVFLFI